MTIEIFEKHPTADAYKVGAAFTEYCILAKEKRFSDAELAAEFQKADADCAVYWITDRDKHMRAWIKMSTLHRFATLPHFDA